MIFKMKPGEHKTVQARILEYASEIGWTFVSLEEAETRRGIKNEERFRNGSLYFDGLLDAKVREFNPRYTEAEADYYAPSGSFSIDRSHLLRTETG